MTAIDAYTIRRIMRFRAAPFLGTSMVRPLVKSQVACQRRRAATALKIKRFWTTFYRKPWGACPVVGLTCTEPVGQDEADRSLALKRRGRGSVFLFGVVDG